MNPNFSTALEHVFLPFTRVDSEKREVTTTLFTTPRVRGDKWNLKYQTLKRAATRYMEMPCIREMHQARAAGKAVSVNFDDSSQTATMVLRVVDDAAWEKVKEGVYRGVSIGGVPIITRGTDIEEFDWIETSLVDRPKDPGALFTVQRAEDAMAAVRTIELPEGASDEELELARGEVSEELERLESNLQVSGLETPSEDDLVRFDHHQPRDDEGKWTIVAGHRISVSGVAIDHNTIHAAKAKFGLSDEVTGALLAAHKTGKITTDHHLYRTLSHAEAKASNKGTNLGDVTTSHIADALAHHGAGGSHENMWHSEAHSQAPKLAAGIGIGAAIGAHQLQKGDTVHFPAHGDKPLIAGVVHKVNPKSVDIGSTVGGAVVGARVKKDDLKRPGFVKRDWGTSNPVMHHIEVARVEDGSGEGSEEEIATNERFQEEVHYHAEAIHAILSRCDEGDEGEAINQVAERLQMLLRGEAATALDSLDEETKEEALERAEGRNSYKTQPRDDIGRWTDGAGHLNADHVAHVLHSEGIHDPKHHDDIRFKIAAGDLKTRADVLKHIDALHAARKAGDKTNEEKPKEEKTTENSADKAKKPAKTGKPKRKPRPEWHETLKKLAKNTAHAFMSGYRKGRTVLGRAEGDESDAIPGLVEEFFDGLEDADDATLEAALHSAIAILDGDEPVERLLDSGAVPVRENLEGGSIAAASAEAGRASLDELRKRLLDSDWNGDRESLRRALHAVLDEISRGEGDVSRAATLLLNDGLQHLDVQRMDVLEGTVSRLEGELSTVQTEAQASLRRAEDAEGEVNRLESTNQTLSTENQRLREMPDKPPAMQFGSVPLVRDFAANQVLPPASSAHVQRAELETEYTQLQLSLQKEPNAAKRESGADRLIALQGQIEALRRVA